MSLRPQQEFVSSRSPVRAVLRCYPAVAVADAMPLDSRFDRVPRHELGGSLTLFVAGSRRSRMRGLARLAELAPGHALLLAPCRSVHTAGMRFALDLLWLDARGEPVRLDLAVAPHRLRSCGRARAVIECNAGDGERFALAAAGGLGSFTPHRRAAGRASAASGACPARRPGTGREERTAATTEGWQRMSHIRERESGAPGSDSHAGDGKPETPAQLDKQSWKGVLKRTLSEFKQDDLTDWAAALTYYGILSLFPGLLLLVSILGIVGASATQPLIDNLGAVAPGPAKEIATGAIEGLQSSQGSAGLLAIVGIAAALWSASNYVGAFMRASNAIYEVQEGRPFWKVRPLQMAITLVMTLLLALCAVAVVVSGPLAETVGDVVGLGSTAVAVWNIVKWPVIGVIFMTMLALLYYAAPNVKHPRVQWVSPGAILAVVLWLVASAAFAFYVANFGSYNKTYGTLGGVIVFLTWLWISNIAVLLGAELNAETERGRQIEGGMDPEQEPFLELRDTTKLDDD